MDRILLLQFIEEHLEEELNVQQLCEIAGYSESHFIRKFKEYTNQTVMAYVCRRRLIKACDDIASGMRLIDVAVKYGWKSHSAFSKSFHREFGFSPSLLRTMKIQLDCLGGGYMGRIFLKTTKIGTGKEELFEILKETIAENGIAMEESTLEDVYRTACKVYEGKRRYSGEEYITHLLNVAILLANIGNDGNVILAGLFCDSRSKGNPVELAEKLPADVWNIVTEIEEKNTEEAILIKLVERLHNMRTIDYIDADKKAQKAKETIEIYMPLARRINNQKLTDELNDLAMKYSV